MKTTNATPMAMAMYEVESFAAKFKKATSKFISTRLVFFQMPTGMFVSPDQQQIWRESDGPVDAGRKCRLNRR